MVDCEIWEVYLFSFSDRLETVELLVGGRVKHSVYLYRTGCGERIEKTYEVEAIKVFCNLL